MLKCFHASLCVIWPLWMLCKARVMVSSIQFPCAFLKVVVEEARGMTRLTFFPHTTGPSKPLSLFFTIVQTHKQTIQSSQQDMCNKKLTNKLSIIWYRYSILLILKMAMLLPENRCHNCRSNCLSWMRNLSYDCMH